MKTLQLRGNPMNVVHLGKNFTKVATLLGYDINRRLQLRSLGSYHDKSLVPVQCQCGTPVVVCHIEAYSMYVNR